MDQGFSNPNRSSFPTNEKTSKVEYPTLKTNSNLNSENIFGKDFTYILCMVIDVGKFF